MTPLSQISMKFVDDSTQPEENPLLKEDQPVNVGLRLKKLKTAETSPAVEEAAEPASELIDAGAEEEVQLTDPVLKIKSGRGRKSIRQISEEADLIQIPDDEILFQKHYYSMGEVADMFRVNQSLLRFWEAEFSILQPKKNKKGDRYFRPIDIKNLHLIYHLLRQRKYTIEGAKDFLKKNSKAEEKFENIKKLEELKRFLLEMKASLG
ncbi:MAG TPA: MerR family transcriptional regulator [Puia sp.]|jgi:DNA-binding transcriptional MerR regulator|nr:MerR family transcriptional regulator [Puia sp.]